ncbi:DNA-directed RNA polymerases II, IV and V subunit 3 [Hibiscus syriacus]|uniref:DNA-directed RNA polymerases II, IV and V subunit 3 n=1 Tax=Hibiscus syriacus TaxID=106335 RepID=A0A6A3B2L4_HIBSY|nr:DNA-directed RNA polymerases II, IV and V subunit 3 [Hibiscus syriacus]
MIAEVPTIAIDLIKFKGNSSILNDQLIAHQLSLIPLTSERAMSMQFSRDCDACDSDGQFEFCSVEFHLRAKCMNDQTLDVTSNDLYSYDHMVVPVNFTDSAGYNFSKQRYLGLKFSEVAMHARRPTRLHAQRPGRSPCMPCDLPTNDLHAHARPTTSMHAHACPTTSMHAHLAKGHHAMHVQLAKGHHAVHAWTEQCWWFRHGPGRGWSLCRATWHASGRPMPLPHFAASASLVPCSVKSAALLQQHGREINCIIAALIAALLQPVNVNRPPIIEAIPVVVLYIGWMAIKRERKGENSKGEDSREKRRKKKGRAQHREDEQRVLRHRLHKVPKPHRLIEENLQEAGFWYVTFVRDYKLVPGLISALIERWRPETHTFHLPCGECTITLEDVALQLGVQTNGMPVVMSHEFNNVAQLCSLFLGKTPVPPECKGWRVRLSWLKNEFQLQPNSNIAGDRRLAFLYREMCKASLVVNDNNTAEIGGCLLLLQSWAWHRLPFLTPISRTAVDFPLAGRWRHKIEGTGLVHNNIKEFRLKIDIKAKKEFNWRPYMNGEILALIPHDILDGFQYWCAVTPLINFAFVEIQFGDRVLRQFHFHQPIPRSPWDHDLLQILDGRRQNHAIYINAWNNRASFMPILDDIQDDDFNFETSAYLAYFLDNGKPFLTTIVERRQFLRFKKRFGKAEYSLPSGSGGSSQQPEAEMTDVDNSAPQPFGDAYIPEFVQPDASIYSPMFSSTYDFEHMSVQMPPTNEEDGYHTPEQPQRPQRIRRPPQHYHSTTPRHRQQL